MSPDIPTHPKIFGDLRLAQLHITGASYKTIGDAPSVPNHIILGYKGRRWELVISDAYETDKHGKRLTPGAEGSTPPVCPLVTDDRQTLYDEVMAQRERARIAERRVTELEERLERMRAVKDTRIDGQVNRIVELEEDLTETDKALTLERMRAAGLESDIARLEASNGGLVRAVARLREIIDKLTTQIREASPTNSPPFKPDIDEDEIREAREARDERQERQHDAARQHAAEGG